MLYEYINTDTEFALKVQEIEEAAVDYAETKLHEYVIAGDRASIMFFLKAKAKDRGYYWPVNQYVKKINHPKSSIFPILRWKLASIKQHQNATYILYKTSLAT
jgi:hypothetical protein